MVAAVLEQLFIVLAFIFLDVFNWERQALSSFFQVAYSNVLSVNVIIKTL